MTQRNFEYLRQLASGDAARLERWRKRFEAYEPISYITGEATFGGRAFHVDRRTYVPNPETFYLVKHVTDYLSAQGALSPLIIDVGTGCGNIAITLAKEFPGARVIGVDILPDSLDVARENAIRHGCEHIRFIEADLLPDDLGEEPDVIIADLPYGSSEYLLPSIEIREFEHMPVFSTFTAGLVDAYVELIIRIAARRWNTALFFECGVLPLDFVTNELRHVADIECINADGYGIGCVRFGEVRTALQVGNALHSTQSS